MIAIHPQLNILQLSTSIYKWLQRCLSLHLPEKNKTDYQNPSTTHFSVSHRFPNKPSVTLVWENWLCLRTRGEGISVLEERRSVLTLYPEVHRLACGLSSWISCQARVTTAVVSRHSLQNKTVCAQDHPRRHILRYWCILQRRVTDYSKFKMSTIKSTTNLQCYYYYYYWYEKTALLVVMEAELCTALMWVLSFLTL